MQKLSTYDDDIYAWAHEQAAALRRLAETRRDLLPNELDLDTIAEELEDVGKSELRTATSFARLVMLHLVKLASESHAASADHCRSEVATFQADLVGALTGAMERHIDLDKQWRLASAKAGADLRSGGHDLLPNLPQSCPFFVQDLTANPFDIEAAIARIVGAAEASP